MHCSIHRFGLKALVLLFAFVLGVSLTRIVRYTRYIHCPAGFEAAHERLDYASLQRVDICDLAAAPELYEGKVVLLTVKPRRQGMVRADELCMKGDPKFNLEFVGGDPREDDREAFWRGGELTLGGRFSKSPAAGNSPKYRFQIFTFYAARLFVPQ